MNGKILTIQIFLLFAITFCDASWVVGKDEPGAVLLDSPFIRRRGLDGMSFTVVYSKSFPGATLTKIVANIVSAESVIITSGGLGLDYVTIESKSEMSENLLVNLEIWGLRGSPLTRPTRIPRPTVRRRSPTKKVTSTVGPANNVDETSTPEFK